MKLHDRTMQVNMAQGELGWWMASDWINEYWPDENKRYNYEIIFAIYAVTLACITMGEELHDKPMQWAPKSAAEGLWNKVYSLVEVDKVITWWEAARMLHHHPSSYFNYALRWERHGNADKKADEA